jgi:2-amino-4-hydroxy-6-hydroxymethyldihydropteridine diphosphokinase
MGEAIILIGSNIDPVENIGKAIKILRSQTEICKTSKVYETEAVGSPGPNFLNLAVLLKTSHQAEELKWAVLRPIEQKLGRQRSIDKNAPRTIDLDIAIFDGVIVDSNLWEQFYMAVPVTELCPDLKNLETGQTLNQVTGLLSQGHIVKIHPEIIYE